ncbi:MAG TPA: molybdopterin-dependent oxidoreductase, partial [Paracoccaceae bacterium]|nr:molybdopterin-dependent oxidoreductase [Paracoccaceae bacterium]
MPKDHGIGASSKRREDVRFLTGKGVYTDDMNLHGQTYAVIVRSQVAHGRIKSIGTAAAAAMPGVLAVFTGEDFKDVGGNPAGWLIKSRNGEPMREPKRPVLAHGKVRHVGDGYAAVVAETYQQAKDAAQQISDDTDIEELPAIIDMRAALADSSNRVHDEIPDNQCFDWGWIEDNRAAVDAAFKAAPHITTLELVNNRLVPNAMEPRASIGEYFPGTGDYKLTTTSQNPHLTRLLVAAFVMGIPENKLTVVAPDVGGGFGSKIYHYGEEALVLAAAKKLGRPVRWTAERSESFLSDAHGRDHVTKIELACDKEGNFLAFRTETMANVGAYLSNFSTATPTFLHGTLMAGPYKVPLVYVNVQTVFTNTAPVDAYRGA